jgi:hypothetical protein
VDAPRESRDDAPRRGSVRRTVIVLGAIAAGFYLYALWMIVSRGGAGA